MKGIIIYYFERVGVTCNHILNNKKISFIYYAKNFQNILNFDLEIMKKCFLHIYGKLEFE